MAKLAYSELELKLNTDTTILPYGDFEIEVRHYLPVSDKIDLIELILNHSVDDNGYYNTIRLELFKKIGIVGCYTNLDIFKELEKNAFGVYDAIVSSGLYDSIIEIIGQNELNEIDYHLVEMIDNIYKYRNSAMGILNFIAADYSALDMSAEEIQKKLSNPENLKVVKEVVAKLG